MRVNIHEAKTNLSRLIASIESGDTTEIEIARAGKVVVRLVPPSPVSPRQPGRLKGKIRIREDFDSPLPEEIMKAFSSNGKE